MRYAIHVFWLLPLLGAAALGADELPQPKKDPSAAPAPLPELPSARPTGPPPDASSVELQRLLRDLRAQRESLRKEERAGGDDEAPAPGPTTTDSNEQEIARLRKRMEELKARSANRAEGPSPGARRPAEPPPLPQPRGDAPGGVLDPVAVAQNYFRAGDYEAALDAYRKVPVRGAPAEERAPVLYMIATCLRKLGKRDEAAKVYRDVVAIKDDPFVADCARWQLETLAWRKDVEAQLAELRQRRKALGGKQ